MKPNLFELTYFETYYFANIINNVLREPFAYLRSLDEFFGDLNYKGFLEPFPKFSRLHNFIVFMIESINYEEINDREVEAISNGKRKLWIEVALDHYGFNYETFSEWIAQGKRVWENINEDDVVEYINELRLSGPYEILLERMAEEIFFIMFLNRQTMQHLNQMLAFQISKIDLDELDSDERHYFRKNGVLKRVDIPMWVQRAVLYRDRGMCVNCHKDISGLMNISSIENYDHIVPLAQGGVNDVTNIQLLCQACNSSKKHQVIETSIKYERWY